MRYARSGDVAIAYQVIGDRRPDIVFARGVTGDLLSTWEQPLLVRHVEGLAACGRLLMLDRRGTGLSDRVREVQSAETAMDDVRAVMDAVESERAEAGIVYRTDAATSRKVRIAYAVPIASGPKIVYPVARVASSVKKGAADFVSFLAGPTAKAVFTRYGFITL